MLQIRLRRVPSSEGAGAGAGAGVAKPVPVETVTVACPDHLVLADLPVAKGIGAATAASLVKTVGRRSRRQLGERVHFCVRCDFPIAIYGRLSPCEHAFCLDCARSDSICFLCDDRIQKIQTIKLMEGIFICAAPHCLKSFLKKTEFESHIHESHADLLQPNAEKEDNHESEAQSAKQSTPDSTVRAPLRPVFSPSSNSQLHDREDKARRQQTREQSLPRPLIQTKPPQGFGQAQNNPSESQLDSRSQGFERPGPHNLFQQQSFDSLGTPKQEPGQYSDKQQGILSDSPFAEYPPMHSIQPPNYMVPVNSNQMMNPSLPFGYPPFPVDGPQPYYGAPFEMARQDSAQEVGSEQGSLLGFPPGPAGNMNFPANYPQPWNAGQAGMPFEPPQGGQGVQDGFTNTPDSQGKVPFYQGEFGRNPGGLAINIPPPSANKPMEPSPGGNAMDPRDGKGILAPQPMPLPPPPPLPPHLSQNKRKYYSGDMGRDGQGFGWQHENRENFGTGQD